MTTSSLQGASVSRYQIYRAAHPRAAGGWSLTTIKTPARTFGSCGIQFSPAGRLWITELLGNQVTSWDPADDSLRIEAPMDGGVHTPDDVAFTSNGVALVTTMHDASIMAVSPGGSIRRVAANCPENNGITVGSGNRVFVDQMRPGGQLWEIFPGSDREPRVILRDRDWGNALEEGPDGRLYMQHFFDGYVLAVDPDTGETERVAEGFDLISAVRFDPYGRLVVLESGSGAVTYVDLKTRERGRLATSTEGLDNCTFDREGRLYLSHYNSGRILRFAAGEDRVDKVVSEGGLIGPYGLAYADEGAFICADWMGAVLVTMNGDFRALSHLANHPYLLGLARVDSGAYIGMTSDGALIRLTFAPAKSAPLPDAPTAVAIGPAGRIEAVVADESGALYKINDGSGITPLMRTGLKGIVAVEVSDDVTVAASPGSGTVFIDRGGETREIHADWEPAAAAVLRGEVFVADKASRQIEHVTRDGARSVVAADLPFGYPVDSPATTRRLPTLLAVAEVNGLLVGCDGDGSVRLVQETR
jgi:streptogramin lyase